jgi:hypothetical protein
MPGLAVVTGASAGIGEAPIQVVEASLADLADDAVVSVPGLADTDSLARSDTASRDLVSLARTAGARWAQATQDTSPSPHSTKIKHWACYRASPRGH